MTKIKTDPSLTIQSLKAKHLEAPLIYPFRISYGSHLSLHNVLLTLRLRGGIEGFGEAAIATHITGETVESTSDCLRGLAPLLRGRSAADYLALLASLSERLADHPAARTALEMAILDALTRAMKIPLWKLFGPRAGRLTTDITLVVADAEQTRRSVEQFVRDGFKRFKIKVGTDPGEDLERILLVHRAAPGAEIMLDANEGFTVRQTLDFVRRLARRGIRPILIEQPVARDDWEGMTAVTARSPVAICADESIRSIADVVRVIRGGCAHAINIKLVKFGFLQAVQMAALARAAGLKLMIGSMVETNLAATAAAHFAAGVCGFDFVDLDTPFFVPGHAEKNPYLARNGRYDVAKVPAGIGITPAEMF